MPTQCVKMIQLSDDQRSVILFPSAEGVSFIKKQLTGKYNRLKESQAPLAGKEVTCFVVSFNRELIKHFSWTVTIAKNECVLYVFTADDSRQYINFPFNLV